MDRFSFEYKDERNDISIRMTLGVNNILKESKSGHCIDIFSIDTEFWHNGVKFNKDGFMKHINDSNFELKNDFGLGGEFGLFCSGIIDMLKMRSAVAKNPEVVKSLRDNIN